MKVEVKGEASESIDAAQEKKKIPLMIKFDIPVEHLDFGYIEKCTDVREIERILRILRSGEEGHYPDLTTVTEARLRKLDPSSRVLRVEVPVLTLDQLDKEERDHIQNDLLDWLGSLEENFSGGGDAEPTKDIFNSEEYKVLHQVPIRGTEVIAKVKDNNKDEGFVKKRNPDRIKSWDYEKWDKLNVEAELTKMDVTDMQISEWEKYQKPKIQKENKTIEKLMKPQEEKSSDKAKVKNKQYDNPTVNENIKATSSSVLLDHRKAAKSLTSTDRPSYIEELPVVEDKPSGSQTTKETKKVQEVKVNSQLLTGRRRFKIQIEDIHMNI